MFVKQPQMVPVNKPVVHFQAHAQCFAAIFRDILAPCDARDVVVLIKIPLVGAAGQVEPRGTGNVDEVIQLTALVQKGFLRVTFGFCRPAEFVQRAGLRQGDDVELLAAEFPVGQAGDAFIQPNVVNTFCSFMIIQYLTLSPSFLNRTVA